MIEMNDKTSTCVERKPCGLVLYYTKPTFVSHKMSMSGFSALMYLSKPLKIQLKAQIESHLTFFKMLWYETMFHATILTDWGYKRSGMQGFCGIEPFFECLDMTVFVE